MPYKRQVKIKAIPKGNKKLAIRLNDRYLSEDIKTNGISSIKAEIEKAYETTATKTGAGSDFLGWFDLPDRYKTEEYEEIKKAAKEIRSMCDVFVVIGIGGSYLGARAAIEFVRGPMYNSFKGEGPEIYFSGNNISGPSISEIIALCEGKDVCVNVISKSGKTVEPAISFRIFRELLEKKYGKEEAKKRIFVTTDKEKGALKTIADKNGYKTFVVPDDIGGRYSVLTPVGLLPIAVAGCDIDKMFDGAKAARDKFCNTPYEDNDCLKYAAYRNLCYRQGKKVEIYACFSPTFAMMNEWLKQLYGESEGKDGKGILPDSVIYSTDLHSLGQIIQQGERHIFETVLDIIGTDDTTAVPFDEEDKDELNYVAGRKMHDISRIALTATAIAHTEGGVPNIVLEIDKMDEENFGYMVYFFELACAVSGYTLGVNPFDQPGVEAYKLNMLALLGKEGEKFEKIRQELNINL